MDIFLVSVITFIVSTILNEYYIYGDPYYYNNFYYYLKDSSYEDVAYLQFQHLGSSEPLYGLFTWIATSLEIEKYIFIGLVNILLTLGIYKWSKKKNASLITIFLLLTNYYVIVMITAAERLKFSYVCLFWALVLTSKFRNVFFLAAPFFHFQTLINYISIFGSDFISYTSKKYGFIKTILLCILVLSIFSGILLYTGLIDAANDKFDKYNEESGELEGILNLVMLLPLGLIVLNKKKIVYLVSMVPVLAMAYLLGPTRVNMIGFFILLYFVGNDNKLNHPLFILLLSYFSYKTIGFVNNIFTYNIGYL